MMQPTRTWSPNYMNNSHDSTTEQQTTQSKKWVFFFNPVPLPWSWKLLEMSLSPLIREPSIWGYLKQTLQVNLLLFETQHRAMPKWLPRDTDLYRLRPTHASLPHWNLWPLVWIQNTHKTGKARLCGLKCTLMGMPGKALQTTLSWLCSPHTYHESDTLYIVNKCLLDWIDLTCGGQYDANRASWGSSI